MLNHFDKISAILIIIAILIVLEIIVESIIRAIIELKRKDESEILTKQTYVITHKFQGLSVKGFTFAIDDREEEVFVTEEEYASYRVGDEISVIAKKEKDTIKYYLSK